MGRHFARPFIQLPVGVLALLTGLLMALGSVSAVRWGEVVEAGTTCESEGQEMCLESEDATLAGPYRSWRQAGSRWEVTPASGDTEDLSLPDTDALEGSEDAVLLTKPEGNPVGVEVGGERVASTWIGTTGLLQLLGLGLVVGGFGAGMMLVGIRIRRSTGSWVQSASVREHGSAWVAIPVVLGFLLWLGALLTA